MIENKILFWQRTSPTVPGWYWVLMSDFKRTTVMYLDMSIRGGAPDNVIAYAGPLIPPTIDPIGLYLQDEDDSKREEDEARTEFSEQGDR